MPFLNLRVKEYRVVIKTRPKSNIGGIMKTSYPADKRLKPRV